MSASVKTAPETDEIPPDWRDRLRDLALQPLWESEHALADRDANNGRIWRWSDMREMMMQAAEFTSPEVIERRVLLMVDPNHRFSIGEAAVGTITASFQLLKPGERARPHRHPMGAIRFVVESTGGAVTLVDGQSLPMEKGDLILTPGWCWHEHVHEGEDPLIWLDVLDVPLHIFFATEGFQPGPVEQYPWQVPEEAFAAPNIVPVGTDWQRNYSPVFRYPWADSLEALSGAPEVSEGVRTVRYVNPLTGGAALPYLDMSLMEVMPGSTYRVEQTTADTVVCPMQGSGVARVGDVAREWKPHDVITVPIGRPFELEVSGDESGIIFSTSNQPVFDQLGLRRGAPD